MLHNKIVMQVNQACQIEQSLRFSVSFNDTSNKLSNHVSVGSDTTQECDMFKAKETEKNLSIFHITQIKHNICTETPNKSRQTKQTYYLLHNIHCYWNSQYTTI